MKNRLRNTRFGKYLLAFFLLAFGLTTSLASQGCKRYTIVVPVSVSTSGTIGNHPSYNPSVSYDGRYVAFESEATNLVEGVVVPEYMGQYRNRQVYVRDIVAGTTEIVSRDYQGNPVNYIANYSSISSDGRFVTFTTRASNVVPNLSQAGVVRVYVRDRQAGTTTLVSKNSNGVAYSADCSNGRLHSRSKGVLFSRGSKYILYHNLLSGTTSYLIKDKLGVSLKKDTEIGQNDTRVDGIATSINADDWIVFLSKNDLTSQTREGDFTGGDGPDTATPNIYLANLQSNRVWKIAQADEVVGGYQNWTVSESSIWSIVVYYASAPDTRIEGDVDTNNAADVYMFSQGGFSSLTSAYLWRVSKSSDGQEANGASINPTMPDIYFIAFESVATNLVPGDGNGKRDIFLRDMSKNTIVIVSRGGKDGIVESDGDSLHPSMSAEDKVIAFESYATNLAAIAQPNFAKPQVYARRVLIGN